MNVRQLITAEYCAATRTVLSCPGSMRCQVDRRRFWTNAVFLWICGAIAAYLIAGAIDWSFVSWLFLFGVVSLPVVLVSARKRRW